MTENFNIERFRHSGFSNRHSKRYSGAALYMSMGGVDPDDDLDDELARIQKRLRRLKAKISDQSKKNFLLEQDVRYLDSRIALIIQNKMGAEDQKEVSSRLENSDSENIDSDKYFPERKIFELYGNLFFVLQSEPQNIAKLCRCVSMTEIDALLQTVMFTIYGNQYEQREEHLLLSMFQSVLAAQFEAATDLSSLLRSNTPVSRMMTTYTRRGPGQVYLRSCLSQFLQNISENTRLNLEVYPMRVYDEIYDPAEDPYGKISVSPEEAIKNVHVQELIKPRLEILDQLANHILTLIINSLNSVPYGIRWICKQIRLLTRRKFPDASDSSVCSLIGAFFFLRFINPAIVTPQVYMLVDEFPSDNPRRVLTLLAKMLQNVVNKPTVPKDPYMTNMAAFVASNTQRVNTLLNDLCEVPDFDESLEMDQYVVLSRQHLELNIAINEIFGMHNLLEKYRPQMNLAQSSHLGILLEKIGTPPPLVPRNENANVILRLYSLWETEVGDVKSDLDVLRSDVVFMEVKALIVNIVRAFPTGQAVNNRPLDLLKIADIAATSNEFTIVKRGIKALDLLKEIRESNPDDYELLTGETEYEIDHLGSLKDSVKQEANSLEEVYKTILDHSNYLKTQIETYRSYLFNVRKHTGSKADRPPEVNPSNKKVKVAIKKYSLNSLVKDKIVIEWKIAEVASVAISNISATIISPLPGSFSLTLLLKGREEPIFVVEFRVDDLLEMRQEGKESFAINEVVLDVKNLLALVSKDFKKR